MNGFDVRGSSGSGDVVILAEEITRNDKFRLFIEKFQIKLLITALESYQEWKTEYVKREEDENGRGFGTRTGFALMDWTVHNAKLRELCGI